MGLDGTKLAQIAFKKQLDFEDYMQLKMLTQLPKELVQKLDITDLV